MKRVIFGCLAIALLMVASCSKNNTTTGPTAYTWSFKGVTDTATTCTAVGNTLEATYSSATNPGNLDIIFNGTSVPTTAGQYTVVAGYTANSPGQVVLQTNIGSNQYNATGGNGTQKVNVTVSATGKLTVTGSAIEMVSSTNHADSAAITFDVAQQ
jgi:hypothetical protein